MHSYMNTHSHSLTQTLFDQHHKINYGQIKNPGFVDKILNMNEEPLYPQAITLSQGWVFTITNQSSKPPCMWIPLLLNALLSLVIGPYSLLSWWCREVWSICPFFVWLHVYGYLLLQHANSIWWRVSVYWGCLSINACVGSHIRLFESRIWRLECWRC